MGTQTEDHLIVRSLSQESDLVPEGLQMENVSMVIISVWLAPNKETILASALVISTPIIELMDFVVFTVCVKLLYLFTDFCLDIW